MFDAIIAYSLRHRVLIGLFTLALVAGGIWAFGRLPIDAVPDITNNQVQVLTQASALSALEVERYVSFPVEIAMKSLPRVVELRSLSRSGLSVVTVVFEEGVDIYFARQQMLERLREVEDDMPDGVERPELAPVSTGLGEVFRYTIRDTTGRLSAMDLRTVQDWIVRRQLLGAQGIAEINALGGSVRQYHVLVRPEALVAFGVTLRDVFEAAARASGNAGAGYIETGAEQFSIRSVGLATGIEDIGAAVVRASATGVPVTIADVADVEIGPALRFGSASQDGRGEVVTGIVMQLKGANARVTVNAVKERIEELKPSLPDGVVIEPYYDRVALVDRTISTVITNLIEGSLLVIGVLLLFLVNLRAGVVVASVIPLSMMFAGIMMVLTAQTGNLMSLGAVDFGLVVDGSLIIVDNVLRLLERRLTANGGVALNDADMRRLVYAGSVEVRKAAQFGEIIIIVVYLPILTLQGIEGKLFKPMALTVVYALIGALVLSVTYVPVVLSALMRTTTRVRHSPLITLLHRNYLPVLRRALAHRRSIVAVTVAMLAAAVFVFTRLGGEFIPRLDEGDIAMHLIRLPSVSLTESQKIATRVERELMQFQEVVTVVSSTGRAEISTDPMGFDLADVFIILKPRSEWDVRRTKAELIEEMSHRLARIPGIGVQFLQPIEMRSNELIAGARGDVVIKVIGEDYDVLGRIGAQMTAIVRATPGAADVTVEHTSGLPQLIVRPDRAAIARYGLTIDDVNAIVATAVGGSKAAEVAEGEMRFDVVVRYASIDRGSVEAIRNIMVAAPGGSRVALSTLASVTIEEGPAQITREDGSRFITVQANVRERDVESFVKQIRARAASDVKLPAGYNIVYGGQFENLQAASDRLALVVPIALGLIFMLLYQTFHSVRLGVMIFLCVPMAVIGGVVALVIAGMPFSISAGVGFVALFGIAVLNGIVMVAAIRKYQTDGVERRDAVLRGADERLRPVVTTAALAAFGFVPMLLAGGAGAEVQRPLATVIIGGLISSTLLTLFVLPIIYDWAGGRYAIDGDMDITGEAGHDGSGRAAIVVLAMLMFAAAPTFAQTPLTLEGMRERVVAGSPELRRSQSVVELRRGERDAAGVLPDLDVFYDIDEAPSAALTGASSTAFGIEQRFALPMMYSAHARVLDLAITHAEAEAELVQRQLTLMTAHAYTELVAAATLLDVADSGVAAAERFARNAERRRELGEINALEPLQAQLALSGAQQVRSRALSELRVATANVLRLMRAPPNESIATSERLSMPTEIAAIAELERRFWMNHPRLRASRIAVESAHAREAAVASEKYPTFALRYSLQTVDGNAGYYGGAVSLGLPLWRMFAEGPDRAARAETALRESELSRDSIEIVGSLRQLYSQYDAARASAREHIERFIPQATEAARVARRLIDEGEASYLELLSINTTLFQFQTSLITHLRDAQRLRNELEYVVGGDLR